MPTSLFPGVTEFILLKKVNAMSGSEVEVPKFSINNLGPNP